MFARNANTNIGIYLTHVKIVGINLIGRVHPRQSLALPKIRAVRGCLREAPPPGHPSRAGAFTMGT